ncbi:TfoX/Sxy family protein [Pyxidicoccus fallax]|uniref:TfoX/Sxy family protein n=1 Tax=Pyxidicoccus fallax TaxID=394095 RepID=A0A848LNT4_9BACT|nr:TfoX/Sxy family protein [Pyxidicoccus fallax]NMO19330.1 TfoX/Sxy family protein [Pyxidicoccus fallax]NPC80022.1 TfoX/Sxy family protein [Pyxidicoccus fallax]
MAQMDSFVEYTVELLEKVGPVQARRFFGGWGLYLGGRMFGFVADGQLFLKADDVTLSDFQAAGGRPFTFESGGKPMETSYWTPPSDAADDAYALLPWARRAVDAAQRAALKKAAPKKKAAAKKQPAPTAKKAPARKKAAPVKKAAAKKAPASRKTARAKNARSARKTSSRTSRA